MSRSFKQRAKEPKAWPTVHTALGVWGVSGMRLTRLDMQTRQLIQFWKGLARISLSETRHASGIRDCVPGWVLGDLPVIVSIPLSALLSKGKLEPLPVHFLMKTGHSGVFRNLPDKRNGLLIAG